MPDPEIIEQDGGILVTLHKNKYSADQLQKLGLNERQVKAIQIVIEKGKISNKEYQALFDVARRTATRDLTELVEKGILKSSETKGAGAYYEI